MPKEWSHWLLAEKTAGKIGNGVLKAAIDAHRDLFLLGATIHDSPYYMPNASPLHAISDKLHGRYGYDTFRPFRRLAPKLFESPGMTAGSALQCHDPRLAAMLAGALCHMAADTVFHPWVFYMTGTADTPGDDGRDRWVFRHREFETALDGFLAAEWGRPAGGRNFRDLAAAADPVKPGQLFFNEVIPCTIGDAAAILERHGKLQSLFTSEPTRLAAMVQGGLKRRGTGGDSSSVFYGHKSRWRFGLNDALSYSHPLTGAPVETTLEALVDAAVARGLEWMIILERGNRSQGVQFPDPSLHLDTGLPAVAGEKMSFFDGDLK